MVVVEKLNKPLSTNNAPPQPTSSVAELLGIWTLFFSKEDPVMKTGEREERCTPKDKKNDGFVSLER